jgi:HPt (histidine-containing phosphotransfer) domain-containing protein
MHAAGQREESTGAAGDAAPERAGPAAAHPPERAGTAAAQPPDRAGPAAAHPPQRPPLDSQRIAELRALFGGAEGADFLTQLRSEVAEQLREIDAALAAGQRTQAAHAAHRIVNSACMIGAVGLVDAAVELEAAAERDLARARRAASRVNDRWVRVSTALEVELRDEVGYARVDAVQR